MAVAAPEFIDGIHRIAPGERTTMRCILHHKEGAIIRILRCIEFRGWDVLNLHTSRVFAMESKKLDDSPHPQDISDIYSRHLGLEVEIGPRLRPRSPETLRRHLLRLQDIMDVII